MKYDFTNIINRQGRDAIAFIKGVTVSKPQGTYMLLVDCSKWCAAHGISMDDLLKAGVSVGVIWQDGRTFFAPDSIRKPGPSPFSCERSL